MRDKKTGAAMRGENGRIKPRTSHTLSPVPLHVYAPGLELKLDTTIARPGLANLAATCLALLGFDRPQGYEKSLIG